MSYRSKIIVLAAGTLIVVAILFMYIFPALDRRSQAVAGQILARSQEYHQLQQEQESFQLANKDLADLSTKPLHPDNFFSQDVHLVKEISTLETAAAAAKLDFSLHVSGTADQALKVPGTASSVFYVPYTVTLSGPFSQAVAFLDRMEHLDFIAPVTGMNISAPEKGKIQVVLNANFYLRK